ncbi:VOC family protein [Streptomyces sp. SAS_276]|uniref:VOC family protein n=1 Tax=Streptomyces sp. SAS_276 TaxID=3412745 RepID=UPI00403D1A60
MLTTRFVNGAPNWLDVGSPDIDSAISFYGGLFGWQFQSAGPEAGGYGFFQLDGRTVAGGMPLPAEHTSSAWTVYFQSPDAEATAKTVEQAHGAVLFQPMDVMGQGHMAILRDPAGAAFGIWQPGQLKGVDVAGDPGSLTWVELYTPDVAAAAAFYNTSLGLETSAAPMAGVDYTCVNPSGAGEDAMFGGIVPLDFDPDGATSGACWLAYFEVTDVDATVAKAQESGGAVTVPATDLEGVGRIAQLTDPHGARFAVIKSEAPQG